MLLIRSSFGGSFLSRESCGATVRYYRYEQTLFSLEATRSIAEWNEKRMMKATPKQMAPKTSE
jgi:hypothetical protein